MARRARETAFSNDDAVRETRLMMHLLEHGGATRIETDGEWGANVDHQVAPRRGAR